MKFDIVTPEQEVQGDYTDFEKMERDSFVSVEEKLRPQPIAISVGSHPYKGSSYPTPLGSYGDYSCIVGSSKSKKTFLKSAITAAYLGGQSTNYFPDIRGHSIEGKYVIDIDTEQSKYHSQRVFKRVTAMVGKNTPYYRSYSLRRHSAQARLDFIDWLLTESKYVGNIGLVLIDGLADLVDDFNDLKKSTNLSEKLLSWSADNQCHIIGILHKNFGSDKPVGHLGSSVLKKAETIIFTEKEGDDLTLVKCEYSRNIPFNDFKFTINSEWLPEKTDMF